MAWWDSCFVMRGIHAEMWCGVDWKSNSSRYRTNRSTLNSRLDQNVQHRGATDANLARHVSGRASRLVQLHHALADTLGRATFRDDGPASESSGRRTKLNGGVVGVLRQGHHQTRTRTISVVVVGFALGMSTRSGLTLGLWTSESAGLWVPRGGVLVADVQQRRCRAEMEAPLFAIAARIWLASRARWLSPRGGVSAWRGPTRSGVTATPKPPSADH